MRAAAVAAVAAAAAVVAVAAAAAAAVVMTAVVVLVPLLVMLAGWPTSLPERSIYLLVVMPALVALAMRMALLTIPSVSVAAPPSQLVAMRPEIGHWSTECLTGQWQPALPHPRQPSRQRDSSSTTAHLE